MPTLKQRRAVELVMENHGNVSRAMLEAGYDPTTAKNPKNLTDSDGWKELMNQYLPDDYLAKKHRQFIDSDKEEIGIKALDMAYKGKGSYAPDKTLNVNVELTDSRAVEELADRLEQLEQERASSSGDGSQADPMGS